MTTEDFDFTDAKKLRIKAEKLLKEKQRKADELTHEADIKKLLHELQVHQIELEMQNEELRRAYDTAETALKKYTMLYDLAPMGHLTLDSNGSIDELNFTAADMLKEKRFSLVKNKFSFYVSEASKAEFNNFFTKVFISNSKESCELKLGYDGNPLGLFYIEGIVTGDDGKCLISMVEISRFMK